MLIFLFAKNAGDRHWNEVSRAGLELIQLSESDLALSPLLAIEKLQGFRWRTLSADASVDK